MSTARDTHPQVANVLADMPDDRLVQAVLGNYGLPGAEGIVQATAMFSLDDLLDEFLRRLGMTTEAVHAEGLIFNRGPVDPNAPPKTHPILDAIKKWGSDFITQNGGTLSSFLMSLLTKLAAGGLTVPKVASTGDGTAA